MSTTNLPSSEQWPIQFEKGGWEPAESGSANNPYRVGKPMRHPRKGKAKDLTRILYNEHITVCGIPEEAYEYMVNGKPAIAWVMERQCVRTDRKSGIVNDANKFALETMGDAAYPLKLLARIISISMKTLAIVRALPELSWAKAAE